MCVLLLLAGELREPARLLLADADHLLGRGLLPDGDDEHGGLR